MTSVEQHKLIAQLCDVMVKMTAKEREEFEMYRKRDKDDEDLDLFSKKRALELFEKYVRKPKPTVNPLDALFKK